MCGRYVQSKRARAMALRIVQQGAGEALRPETWNLAPSTLSMAVRAFPDALAVEWLSWGLDAGAAPVRPINARVETAATKPTFREAWNSRRCAVPTDGWYEWRMEKGRKQPYFFRRRDEEPIFFAGLWTGSTFCLLTTAADGELTEIHDRRPLALRTDDVAAWIEETPPSVEQVVFSAVPAAEIAFHPVSSRVSSPRNDGPSLIAEEKAAPQTVELDLFQNPA